MHSSQNRSPPKARQKNIELIFPYLHSHDDPGPPPAELPRELNAHRGVGGGHQDGPPLDVAPASGSQVNKYFKFEFILIYFLFVGDCLPRRAGAPLGEAADEEEHEEEDADDADHLMILNEGNPN